MNDQMKTGITQIVGTKFKLCFLLGFPYFRAIVGLI